jgi:arylsulfatase A-like enzyme
MALACSPVGTTNEGLSAHPPIILVTIDTLRADHLSCYGYFRNTSPTLDALAAEGIQFDRVVSPMATTLPAHVSMFTSQYPLQTGVTRNGRQMAESPATGVRLFAQMLQDLGYTTAAFVSSNSLKRYTGISVGFDHWDEPTRPFASRQRTAHFTTDAALDWLDDNPQSPFFLWVHYFDPHETYEPPPPFHKAFSTTPGQIEFLASSGYEQPIDPELLAVNNLYDGEILFTDSELARIFDALKAKGLWKELVLVFVADHGEGLGQHDHMGHGEIYNEQIMVPLIIKLPDAMNFGGRRVDRLTSLIDLVPTLVATLGLELPDEDLRQFNGVNALAPEPAREFAFAQRTSNALRPWGKADRFALVSRRWKFVHDTAEGEHLYDLAADPAETRNLLEERREIAEQLRHRLFQEIAVWSESEKSFEVLEVKAPEILDELRALGYVE